MAELALALGLVLPSALNQQAVQALSGPGLVRFPVPFPSAKPLP